MAMPAPSRARHSAALAESVEPEDFEAAVAAPQIATIAQAEVETKGSTVTFNLPRSMSVPADGQPHRSLIALSEFPCRLDYRAVPQRTELAYLRASVTNDSELSLLPGSVNIFRDGVFIGSSNLEAIAPGQGFKLFLGADEQVRTKRELTRRDVDKNLMGNVRRHTYAHLIKLENLKPYRVSLTVLDQIPVSRHEQIKVKLRHAEPAPQTDDLGELRWELVLAPESKQELSYEYTVESPREMVLSGLTE
jgi:uncharacterized protein (TIGR02231 family)